MTLIPQQSAILSGGYSPWQAPLAALFSGISAAAQPGGFANFGAGAQQGLQNIQQGQAQQQMMALRQMQIEQAQEEMRRANQEDAQRQATIERLRALAGPAGSPPTPVRQIGSYGAATGGVQPAPQSAMFGDNPRLAAIFSGYLDAGDVGGALDLLAQNAQPQEQKLTDDQREYEFARSQGYQGSFLDFLTGQRKAGATNVTVDVPGAPMIGTIPQGFAARQLEDGSWVMEAVPGGPAAIEEGEKTEKKTAAESRQKTMSDIVTEDIKRTLDIVKKSPGTTTGIGGQLLSGVGGTPAHNVRSLVQTIRANVGFEQLQQMRAASPTGGALGPVSDAENALLQSVMGALEQSQSQEQFEYNLGRLHDTILDIVHGPGSGGERLLANQPSDDGYTVIDGVKIKKVK